MYLQSVPCVRVSYVPIGGHIVGYDPTYNVTMCGVEDRIRTNALAGFSPSSSH